jgi:GDP-4-dehydro-6-deoxy-D-mannose reductase
MKKILVTGATGFVGSHIVDSLLLDNESGEANTQIYGSRRYHLSRRDKSLHFENKIKWIDCDITDAIAVNEMIKNLRPDEIYHMAAESFVSPSWNHPSRYMDVNYNGTVNILDAIKNFSPNCKILLPGSGEEYGLVEVSDLPISEKTKLQPVNPYAVTKIAQDLIGYVYFKSYGLNVIRLRTFNHEGPRRERYFGIASFAYQIAKMEIGLQGPELFVGEILDKRNFTHVKDVVNAYKLAMKHNVPGKLYLVGSESDSNIDTFEGVISRLLRISTIKESVKITRNMDFVRPTSVPYLLAESTEFSNLTGWKPSVTLDEILVDVLHYWRNRVRLTPDM